MGTIASQINSLTIVHLTVYSDADQRKHQRSTSLAFLRGIHRGPVNSAHKWPVTRKMFPFDDVIMKRTKLNQTKTLKTKHRQFDNFVVTGVTVSCHYNPKRFAYFMWSIIVRLLLSSCVLYRTAL